MNSSELGPNKAEDGMVQLVQDTLHAGMVVLVNCRKY